MLSIFKSLLASYPWPDVSTCRGHDFTLGGGGRELIERELNRLTKEKNGGPIFMLEIGCFMCASTRRWLATFPNLYSVGVDPWPEEMKQQVEKYVDRPLLNRLYPDPADQQRFVHDVQTQSPLKTGLANIKAYQDRFVPVQGYSPSALAPIAKSGFVPDLVYIDGAKQAEDLTECHRLWPTAKITGDDWHWGRTYGYPMRKIVKKFAAAQGFGIEANWATWVLHADMDSMLVIQAGHKSDLAKLAELAKATQKAIDFTAYLGRMLVLYQDKRLVGAGLLSTGAIDHILVAPDVPHSYYDTLEKALLTIISQEETP